MASKWRWNIKLRCGCERNGEGREHYGDYSDLYYTQDDVDCPVHGTTQVLSMGGWNW